MKKENIRTPLIHPMRGSMAIMYLLVALSTTWTIAPLKAAILVLDYLSPSDGMITRDTVNNLDWLDWTVTTNRSYADVSTKLSSGMEFEGWRFATGDEFLALLSSAGVPANYINGSEQPVNAALDALGEALGTTSGNSSLGGSGDLSGANQKVFVIGRRLGTDPLSDPDNYYASSIGYLTAQSSADLQRGSALVRSVPEPSSAFLLGLGGIVIMMRKSRR